MNIDLVWGSVTWLFGPWQVFRSGSSLVHELVTHHMSTRPKIVACSGKTVFTGVPSDRGGLRGAVVGRRNW